MKVECCIWHLRGTTKKGDALEDATKNGSSYMLWKPESVKLDSAFAMGFRWRIPDEYLTSNTEKSHANESKLIPSILQSFSGIACHLSSIHHVVLQRKSGLDVV